MSTAAAIQRNGEIQTKAACRLSVHGTVALLALVLVLFAPAHAADFTGKVVSVADGDTLSVAHDTNVVPVRLNGIDCPEAGQPYGDKARMFTSALALDENVTVRVVGTDKYGRTLGDVILSDGRELNQELVKVGLAWWYREYSTSKVLEQLESEARTAKRALWQDPNRVAPWDWRHRKDPSPESPRHPETPRPNVTQTPPQPDAQEVIVFVTRTGAKYHRDGCRYLAKSSIPMKLKDAKAAYTPCSVCNPPR